MKVLLTSKQIDRLHECAQDLWELNEGGFKHLEEEDLADLIAEQQSIQEVIDILEQLKGVVAVSLEDLEIDVRDPETVQLNVEGYARVITLSKDDLHLLLESLDQ